jgi:hypothetical protein
LTTELAATVENALRNDNHSAATNPRYVPKPADKPQCNFFMKLDDQPKPENLGSAEGNW